MSTFHTPFFRSELILRRGLTFLYFFHPDLPIHCGQTCVLFDGVLSDHHDRGTKRATKTNENCPVNIYIHPTASRKCSSPCLASSSLIDTVCACTIVCFFFLVILIKRRFWFWLPVLSSLGSTPSSSLPSTQHVRKEEAFNKTKKKKSRRIDHTLQSISNLYPYARASPIPLPTFFWSGMQEGGEVLRTSERELHVLVSVWLPKPPQRVRITQGKGGGGGSGKRLKTRGQYFLTYWNLWTPPPLVLGGGHLWPPSFERRVVI